MVASVLLGIVTDEESSRLRAATAVRAKHTDDIYPHQRNTKTKLFFPTLLEFLLTAAHPFSGGK